MEAYLDVLEVLPPEKFFIMKSVVVMLRNGNFEQARSSMSRMKGRESAVLRAVSSFLRRKYVEVIVQCRQNMIQPLLPPTTPPLSSSSSCDGPLNPISNLFLLSEAYAKSGDQEKAIVAARLCCDAAQEQHMSLGDTVDELGVPTSALLCLSMLGLALRMKEAGRMVDAKGCFARHGRLCRQHSATISPELTKSMKAVYRGQERSVGYTTGAVDMMSTQVNNQAFDPAVALQDITRILEHEEMVLKKILATKFKPPVDNTGVFGGLKKPKANSSQNQRKKTTTKHDANTNHRSRDMETSMVTAIKSTIPVSIEPVHAVGGGRSASRRDVESDMRRAVERLQQEKFHRHRTSGYDRRRTKDVLVSQLQAIVRGAIARMRHKELGKQLRWIEILNGHEAALERKEAQQKEIMAACAFQLERRGIFA